MKTKFLIFSLIFIFLGNANLYSQNELDSTIVKEISNSAIFKQSHTGFDLYDIQTKAHITEYQSSKYFVPASNTKIFTLYAGLTILKDSIPALNYSIIGDTLFFCGTGDPSFLHPDLPNSKVFDFLKNWNGVLVYCENKIKSNLHQPNTKFGIGWAWDDYNDYYQVEINDFPMYGNIVRFKYNKYSKEFTVSPRIFKDSVNAVGQGDLKFYRNENRNFFDIYGGIDFNKNFDQDVPFITSSQLNVRLLEDTLKRNVLLKSQMPQSSKRINSIVSDSVFKRMMQWSDNMLAEQTMLLCDAAKDTILKSISINSGIEYVLKNHLSDLPDEAIWIDGSGLSRQNLFTPRTIVGVLEKIYNKIPQERLFSILSTGGKSGTLRNMFKSKSPYIFAKTGSLSNVYNLSGFIISASGKVLIFSFMNNNYSKKTAEIRREVERILKLVHEKY